MVNLNDVKQFVEEDLRNNNKYLTIPSISAHGKGINESVEYLEKTLKALGAKVVKRFSKYKFPVIYAYFEGKSNKTILFYNHYDVQPPEPLDKWHTNPFEPTYKDGLLIARGVSDDKGELMSRLSVIKYFQNHGGLPCNLKLFIEGEEEIGSPHIENYVEDAKDYLKCDAIIWECGGKNDAEQFQLYAGVKGITTFEVEVTTANSDAHSSLAGYLDNAAWRLVQGLSSLYDSDNQIHIDGFFDGIIPLDEDSRRLLNEGERTFNANGVINTFEIKSGKLSSKFPYHTLVNEPAITINGISSGYEGQGVKTVIPRYAKAKLDCRLLPGQNPEEIPDLVQRQLQKNGFSDLHVKYIVGEQAFRTDLHSDFVRKCVETAQEVFGCSKYILVPNMPGSGPMLPFYEATKSPIIGFGVRYKNCKQHAPNENIRIDDYKQASAYLANLLEKMAD